MTLNNGQKKNLPEPNTLPSNQHFLLTCKGGKGGKSFCTVFKKQKLNFVTSVKNDT